MSAPINSGNSTPASNVPPITWHIFPITDHPFIAGMHRELQLIGSDECVNDANDPNGGWFIVSMRVIHYTDTILNGVSVRKEHKDLERIITLNADGKPWLNGVVPMFQIGVDANGQPIMVNDFQYVMILMHTMPDYQIVLAQITSKNTPDSVTGLTYIDLKCNYNMV